RLKKVVGAPREMFELELLPEDLADPSENLDGLGGDVLADAVTGDDRESHVSLLVLRAGSCGIVLGTAPGPQHAGFLSTPSQHAALSTVRSPTPSPFHRSRTASRGRGARDGGSFRTAA